MPKHLFWLLLTAAVIIWYSTITVFVAWKGFKDIKDMLGRLGKQRDFKKST
jgi:hypothetical protein